MSNKISKYFSGFAAKRLSEVEIRPTTSNQHEFNGITEFREILGTEKKRFTGKFLMLSDDEEKILESEGFLTWYDARKNHAVRTEYRLYYSTNPVIQSSTVGDLVIIAKSEKEELIVIVAPASSSSEKQLLWLFGLSEIENKFVFRDLSSVKEELDFAGKYILSSLGIGSDETEDGYLDLIFGKFGKQFPPTNLFSEFARSTLKDVSPVEEPDKTLLLWMEREELLFKTLEKFLVAEKLKEGFGNDGLDVDDFVYFSKPINATFP